MSEGTGVILLELRVQLKRNFSGDEGVYIRKTLVAGSVLNMDFAEAQKPTMLSQARAGERLPTSSYDMYGFSCLRDSGRRKGCHQTLIS